MPFLESDLCINTFVIKGEMSHAVEITKMKISMFYHLPVTQATLEKIQKFLCCSVVEIRGGENSNSRSVGAVHPIASRHRLTMSAMCGKMEKEKPILFFNYFHVEFCWFCYIIRESSEIMPGQCVVRNCTTVGRKNCLYLNL